MGKGFTSGAPLRRNDDFVNGAPSYPINLSAPNTTESFRGTDLVSGGTATATAILLARTSAGGGFDPYLRIFNTTLLPSRPNGELIAQDDDSFGNLNARTQFLVRPSDSYSASIQALNPSFTLAQNLYLEIQVDDAGNTTANALDVGSLSGIRSFEDFVGLSDTSDYYKFTLASASRFTASLTNLRRDVDIELLNASGFNVASSSRTGTAAEALDQILNPGTYYVKASLFNTNVDDAIRGGFETGGGSNYSLSFAATAIPTVQFSQASPYQANEGSGTSNSVTLIRSGNTATASQVRVSITGGTATAGIDYTNTDFPLTINFAAGETSKTVAIPILQDTAVEGTEPITFAIAGLSNATIGTANTATLQILDDDQSTGGTGGTGGSRTGSNPTDLALSSTIVAENQPIGTTVGMLSTTDPDDPTKTGPYIYSLVPVAGNTDSNAFEVVGNQLKAKAIFDFEAKNSYSIRVRTTDSTGLTFNKDLRISIRDVPELPPLPPVITPKQPNPVGQSIVGTSENNRLPGTAQDDLIRGLKGDDKLNGKAGNDILVGGAGNDLLRGGAGDDIFRGGQGNDTCVLNGGFDTIQGFSDGQDKLKLSGLSFANLTITQQGNDTLVRSGNSPILLITGVNSSLITAADFV